MVSDNYFRSVSGLPPASYPEQQLSLLALKQNSDYLTTLGRLEVHSILRTLEQPGMYVDRSTASNQSSPLTPARSGSRQGTPSRWTAAFTFIDLKEGCHSIRNTTPHQHSIPLAGPLQVYKYQVHLKSPIHKVWHYWEPKVHKELPYAGLLPCTSWTQQWQPLQVQ